MDEFEMKNIKITCEVVAHYNYIKHPGNNLIILLHGYGQTSQVILKKISPLVESASVLSISAPFPIPERIDGKYRLGFSWYFYDPKRDEFIIDMSTAPQYVAHLVASLGLEAMNKVIVGYSQGGYVMPFVAMKMTNISKLIGIACQYLDDELPTIFDFPIYGVHGANDEVVDPIKSKASFENLKKRGAKGDFFMVSGAGHGISEQMLSQIKKLI